MKKLTGIIWGIVLVAVGVVFALNAFGMDIDIFFDGWWTLFIIIPCAIGLFSEREKLGNIIGLGIGVFLLLCAQDILSFEVLWKIAVPAIIVIIGLKLIFSNIFGNRNAEEIKKLREDGKTLPNGTATFSGQDMKFDNEYFEGAELNAVFGGVKCDLRGAYIDHDCVITASAIFGGIDIYVPETVNVKIKSNSLFGGVSDKSHKNSKDNTVTLYVDATCMFGGLDIK